MKSHTSALAAGFAALFGLLAFPGSSQGLSIDARQVAIDASPRVSGRVVEARPARDPDGVLRTHVVLASPAGLEVARFSVPGGREGGVLWVVDGVPSFVPGEEVEVALVPSPAGPTVADTEDAVLRLAPAQGGRSGSVIAGITSHVETVTPSGGGAVPDVPILVAVRGADFGPVQGDSRVTFQGLFERVDAQVFSWSDTEILCQVPTPGLRGEPQVLSGSVKVWTAAGGWSDGDPFAGGARFSVLYQWAGDSWPNARLPLVFYINPEGFPWGAASGGIVRQAAEAWNVPGSYVRLRYGGLTQALGSNHGRDGIPRDGRNTVRWLTDWPHPPSWLAVTWSALDTLTYERLETELEINGEQAWTLDPESDHDAFDLLSTLTHEFGHWLRLGHTQQVASVMLAFASPGVRRRDLSAGDRAGASWIHPSFGVIETAPDVPSGGAIEMRVRALDREGMVLAGLLAMSVEVRAVPLGPAGSSGGLADGSPLPGPLEPPQGDGLFPGHALKGTDVDGWTTARVEGLSDGLYRLEVKHRGNPIRPAPVVRVGASPAPVASELALAGVSPQPLARGVRGLLRFSLPSSAHVRLDLYDVRGARVREVANQRFPAGPNEVAFQSVAPNGISLAAGIYYLRMTAVAGATFEPKTRRVVLLP